MAKIIVTADRPDAGRARGAARGERLLGPSEHRTRRRAADRAARLGAARRRGARAPEAAARLARPPPRLGAGGHSAGGGDGGPLLSPAGGRGNARRSVHRSGERRDRLSRRHDRRGRRRADDADADPAVRRQAVLGDLQRPRGGRDDAPDRRRRAPAPENGQPAPGRLDGARLGADGLRRLLPAEPDGPRENGAEQHRAGAGHRAADRRERDGAALHPRPALRPGLASASCTTSRPSRCARSPSA